MSKYIMKLSMVLAAVLFVGHANAQNGSKTPKLLDVLTLQEGKSYQDAQGYFDLVIPIIEPYGLKRLSSLEVMKKMAGHESVNPNIVQVWELRADDPFSGIFADPAYLKHVDLRDSIFQMDKTQLWMSFERMDN